MFRWLKDRKKQKKGQRRGDTHDDYGFHAGNKENEDKSYHIYEEIPDLPHLAANRVSSVHSGDDQSSSFRDTSFSDPDHSFDHSSVFNAETLRKYIIGSQDRRTDHPAPKRDGPYMVVPLLNSGEEEKPPLPPPNEKKTEFTCALVGRRHSSLSRSTESGVEVSYDSSESQGSETNFPEEQLVEVEVHSPGSSASSSFPSGSKSRRHVREGSLDTSDTGCEYDMGTSSESDHTNYEYYLNKIEQNLHHKCKIREIIQQSVPEEEESDCESLTTVSSVSCCSSVRAARATCGHRSTDIDSDEGTLADHSESENSSGYYETFNGKGKRGLGGALLPTGVKGPSKRELKSCLKEHSQDCPTRQHYIKNKKRTMPKKCKHRSVDALGLCIPGTTTEKSCKHRNVDALSLCTSNKSAFRKVNKPHIRSMASSGHRSKDRGINRLYGMSSCNDLDTSSIKLDLYEPFEGSAVYGSGAAKAMASVDSEGREVYSPPPSVRNFSSRTSAPPSKCSMPRSTGFTNVYRSKGSQNRLLSDLIIMNYDRQLFIH